MPEQYLNGSEVARGLVDDRRLGSAQGMGAIFPRCQTNGGYPLVYQPRVLTRAQVAISIDAARKCEVIDRAASSPKPGQQANYYGVVADGARSPLCKCMAGAATDPISDENGLQSDRRKRTLAYE
jgi:hypothetical protein